MSYFEESSLEKKKEQEERLERLSALNQTLLDMSFERHKDGVYNASFSTKEYYLVCEAMKEYLLSTAREIQAQEGSKASAPQDTTLTAEDFTDIHEIYREYSGTSRSTTYIFTCKIQGEPDILTYELSLHDEYTEGFYLHTEKNDIWDDWDTRMGWKELEKLQKKANSAVAFGTYDREIRRAESPSELINLQYSLWDDDDPDLTPGLREQIEQRIDQKIDRLRENCISKEEWIFDLADPVERYAIYQLDTEKLKGKGNGYMFMGLDYVEKHGMKVQADDYYLAYGGVLEPGETLDSIYQKFNLNRPGDFKGHSLSISDVVILNRGGEVKAYYVDSWSFKELPDFAAEREQITSRHDLSIHWGSIKRDIYTAVNVLETKARDEHYDLLRQAGFDNDFPDNQAYAQRVTEQKQEMQASSEQNARRSKPGIKR